MTKIKICGLMREEDAVLATQLGADFLGFIFVQESARYVEPERVASIAAAVRQARPDDPPKVVGVFRDASVDYVREIVSAATLDYVQLHGNETDEEIQLLDLPVIKSFRVGDTLPDTTAAPSAEWHLFDSFDERRLGGTGRRFDWSLLAMYPRSKPFLLAGGLDADNAAAAISLVRPDAIDIASGVEAGTPGIKDPERMRALFERVRRAAYEKQS